MENSQIQGLAHRKLTVNGRAELSKWKTCTDTKYNFAKSLSKFLGVSFLPFKI